MRMKNKIAALMILTAFNFSNIVQAASIDEELAVIAAEQEEPFAIEKNSSQIKSETPQEQKSSKELRAEEKRLREEKKAEEKKLKEDMKNAEKEFKDAQDKSRDQDKSKLKISNRDSSQKNFPKIDPVNPQAEKVELEKKPEPTPVVTPKPEPVQQTTEPETEVVTFDPKPETVTPTPQPTPVPVIPKLTTPPPVSTPAPVTPIPEPVQPTQPVAPAVNLANPLVSYSNFEELADVVNFTPLYIPKKSGFSIDSMAAIDGRVAEIRYGRRWEPEVSLRVRTYKRADGEELKDISGVHGVKWRVDMASGTSVYIAKIEENKHVAAWAAGDYTFSAQAENLSFAAFHAIIVEELVDLSTHYYGK